MPSANKQYVVVKYAAPTLTVYGNRHGEPFGNEVNAQRSLTRRKGKRNKTGVEWEVMEISK